MTTIAGFVGGLACLACGGGGGGIDGPRQDTIYLACTDNGTKLIGEPGTEYHVSCPSMCSGGTVYGTDIYADDSKICSAAIHAGVINSAGGFFLVTLEPGQDSYTGSTSNSISSRDWTEPWHRSYRVHR